MLSEEDKKLEAAIIHKLTNALTKLRDAPNDQKLSLEQEAYFVRVELESLVGRQEADKTYGELYKQIFPNDNG